MLSEQTAKLVVTEMVNHLEGLGHLLIITEAESTSIHRTFMSRFEQARQDIIHLVRTNGLGWAWYQEITEDFTFATISPEEFL